MHTPEQAKKLARTMVKIGDALGRKTVALITDMDQPLGMAVGNGLEVREAIEVLSGKIKEGDMLYEVCMLLAENMLRLSGLAEDDREARAKLTKAIETGAGLKKLEQMLTALGARDAKACIADPDTLCTVKKKVPVYLNGEGYITGMHAADIGNAAQKLGAGRAEKTDIIDPAVGLVMHKRRGDFVKAGEPVATMYVNDESRLEEAEKTLRGAIELGAEKPEHEPMVYDVIK